MTATTMVRTAHIRTGVRRAGKRINDGGNPGQTICGAALTDRDVTLADARKLTREQILDTRFPVCQMCLAKMPTHNAHTQGPWVARFKTTKAYSGALGQSRTCSVENDRQTRIVAHIIVSEPEDEANANLITAAPEMFRFVEAFAACPTEGEVPGHWSDKDAMDEMIRTARKIVAKAEGRGLL